VLWHLVVCPSPKHDAYMRSIEPVASLADLGDLLCNPPECYRCPDCEPAETEGAEQWELHEVAEAPPSVDEALRRAGEAFRWAVEAAATSDEGAPARLAAFADLSRA
jgi:hypothetical protein